MSGRFWLISGLSLVVALLVGIKLVPNITSNERKESHSILWVSDVKVDVEIVDEKEEMSLGLGSRGGLDENSGMLFIYDRSIIPVFWMKGMRFDLDFVWIREGLVVEITKNVPYPTNSEIDPPLIRPSELSDWILEVNAGYVDKNGIQVGDEVRLEQ